MIGFPRGAKNTAERQKVAITIISSQPAADIQQLSWQSELRAARWQHLLTQFRKLRNAVYLIYSF